MKMDRKINFLNITNFKYDEVRDKGYSIDDMVNAVKDINTYINSKGGILKELFNFDGIVVDYHLDKYEYEEFACIIQDDKQNKYCERRANNPLLEEYQNTDVDIEFIMANVFKEVIYIDEKYSSLYFPSQIDLYDDSAEYFWDYTYDERTRDDKLSSEEYSKKYLGCNVIILPSREDNNE